MLRLFCERHGLTMEIEGNRRTISSRPRNIGSRTCALAMAESPQAGRIYVRDGMGKQTVRFCEVTER